MRTPTTNAERSDGLEQPEPGGRRVRLKTRSRASKARRRARVGSPLVHREHPPALPQVLRRRQWIPRTGRFATRFRACVCVRRRAVLRAWIDTRRRRPESAAEGSACSGYSHGTPFTELHPSLRLSSGASPPDQRCSASDQRGSEDVIEMDSVPARKGRDDYVPAVRTESDDCNSGGDRHNSSKSTHPRLHESLTPPLVLAKQHAAELAKRVACVPRGCGDRRRSRRRRGTRRRWPRPTFGSTRATAASTARWKALACQAGRRPRRPIHVAGAGRWEDRSSSGELGCDHEPGHSSA